MPEYENEKNIQFINERQTSTLQSVVQINLNLKIVLSNEKKIQTDKTATIETIQKIK